MQLASVSKLLTCTGRALALAHRQHQCGALVVSTRRASLPRERDTRVTRLGPGAARHPVSLRKPSLRARGCLFRNASGFLAREGARVPQRRAPSRVCRLLDGWARCRFRPSLALSAVSAIVAGLVPAFRASRVDLTEALKGTSRGSSATGGRFTKALLASQMALVVVLLVHG